MNDGVFMAYFYVASYLLFVCVTGYAAVSMMSDDRRRPFVELFALSSSIGCGIVSFLLFYASLAGLRPSRGVLLTVLVGALLVLVVRRGNLPSPRMPVLRGQSFFRLALAVVSVTAFLSVLAITLCEAILMPLWQIDSYMIWMYKASVLYHQDILSTDYFKSMPLSYSHLDYPLLVPFLVSGMYAAAGCVDDSICRLVFPFLFVSFYCLAYVAFRWRMGMLPALVAASVMATLPPVVQWTSSGTADVVLALYYMGCVYYSVKFIEERRGEDMALAILFTVFCAFTKSEGMALGLINLLVFSLYRVWGGVLRPRFDKTAFPDVLRYVLIVVGLLAPWLWLAASLPQTHENYPGRMSLAGFLNGVDRIPAILCLFCAKCMELSRWGVIWLAAFVVFAATLRRDLGVGVNMLRMLLAAHIVLYMLVFVVSPWEPSHLSSMALERLLLHAVPAAFLVITYSYPLRKVGI